MRGSAAVALVVLFASACASTPPAKVAPPAMLAAAAAPLLTLGPNDLLFVGAGDIANCGPDLVNAEATALLIERFPQATVFAAGDNAYGSGTLMQYQQCYDPTWGRFKARTKPTPGNHEYKSGAAGYFSYFAGIAPDYSFDLGNWHIVSLNSEKGKGPAKSQLDWLENDLRETNQRCIAAFWHHPLFSSGSGHGNNPKMRPFWTILQRHKADVVINGHDHDYERFAQQDDGGAPSANGIREFVVGTGGKELRSFRAPEPNSEARALEYGVLVLTLRANSYEWAFLRTDGVTLDRSSGPVECHD
ncbi:MAG TPA: metallophosphoesterase [Thermoanaerobaculia bacterium]|jgi:hypothetical protein